MMLVVAARSALALLALAACSALAAPSTNLRASAQDYVSREQVVEQLELLLGHYGHEERVSQVQELLRPIFGAMPKNAFGGLGHRVTRHALYRYFLVNHGWYVRGLALEADEKTASSSPVMRKSQMPSFIIDIVEERARDRGIGLEELAVLALTIERVVQGDGIDLLLLAYRTHGYSTDEMLDAEELNLLIRTFTLYFVMPEYRGHWEKRDRMEALAMGGAGDYYPGWEDAAIWVDDLRQALMFSDRMGADSFSSNTSSSAADYSFVARLATQIHSEFGHFSDLECKTMKNKLIDLEDVDREDGRVRLANFYGPFLADTSFHFSETPAYLKHLGALDDRNPRQMSVIVPNLMYAKTNCLGESGFHMVCCIDDCEILLSGLEQELVGPVAAPVSVAHAVSMISSETVAAPRNLSAPLLQRLDAIAARHEGSIPLHGRLFAEWLHYAFPNECPYPRSLNTGEASMTGEEWSRKNNRITEQVSLSEMRAVMAAAGSGEQTPVADDGPVLVWSDEEKLLGELDSPPARSHPFATVLRVAAGAGVLLAGLSGIKSALGTGQAGGKGGGGLPYSASIGRCV